MATEIQIADKQTLDTVNTKVGTNTDAAGTTTIFARLKQIYDYLTGNLSSTRAAKIDNLDVTISSRQASWGATATHSSRIDTTISSRAAQTTADNINNNLGSNASAANPAGDVHAKLKDIREAFIPSVGCYASDTVQKSADTERTVVSPGGTVSSKIKRFVAPYSGFVRIKADMKRYKSGGSGTGNVRFDVDIAGSDTSEPHYVQASSSHNTYVTLYTDVPVQAGDTIEIIVSAYNEETIYVKNAKLCFDSFVSNTD